MTLPGPARPAHAAAFLAAAGWGTAARRPLAGDASPRRYERLVLPSGATAVLMDADPATGEDVRPFLAIARHLARLGLSPPAILAEDAAGGFLLLEDLGDDLFARLCARDPGAEPALYAAAVDALVHLHRHAAPAGLAAYDPATMGTLAGLAAEWYRTGATGADMGSAAAEAGALAAATADALAALAGGSPVLVLRDFHAENLLWLPGRAGPARVGLLDFQDARAGHPGYDLVSLAEDARRDLAPGLGTAIADRYAAAAGLPRPEFAAACAALAAQRNLRILGVFARLAMHHGKPQYVALIPRVWGHLTGDLAHPALSGLAAVARATLPEPTPERLARIVARCGSVPTR
ncbi:MAG: phosphotransferase [Rhodobacteraceae bacterium]|nr:phosphotransferase [Paracoccaceae bacterium]